MKSFFLHTYIPFFCWCLLAGCEMQNEFSESPHQNFEALWKIMDEHYCFFEYKEVDWDAVYQEYSGRIEESMTQFELFYVLADMLNELQDGHINLISQDRTSRYDNWFLDYPVNFNESLLANYYFQGNYDWESDEVKYILLREGEVGYLYYPTFLEGLLESELDRILLSFEDCKGIIVDVRNNSGGFLTNSDRLASRFLAEKTLCAYIQHKTEKGHSDFSDPYPIYLHPSKGVL